MSHLRRRLGLVNEFITSGQLLAIEQLVEISKGSDGQLEIVEIISPEAEAQNLQIRLSIETRQFPIKTGGFSFRSREGLNVYVPSKFPLKAPSIYFVHKRFMGYPHVQWGSYICLYQSSEIEWLPSDGMYGFVERLRRWFEAAATAELAPENAPLHPPAVYASSKFKICTTVNAPNIKEGSAFWVGAAHLRKRNKICFDLCGWTELEEDFPTDTDLAATVLLNAPLPMEYPDKVFDLIETLEQRGVPFPFLYKLLRLFTLTRSEDQDLYFFLGAPMRRKKGGEPLKQHLVVWRIPAEFANHLGNTIRSLPDSEDPEKARTEFFKWAASASTEWCTVFENREEIIRRRDENTIIRNLLGKRVLLLGCGALGSHIAEFITRANAKSLTLVDKGNACVSLGILVRQLFEASDVGYSKASALKVRLERINNQIEIEHKHADLRNGALSIFEDNNFDLVIDATASRSVSQVIETELDTLKAFPPIISCAISSEAKFGMVSVRMPDYQGGPIEISRRAKISALGEISLRKCAASFWPKKDNVQLFQPEPGCSEPTFVASAADISYFSSSFLNIALRRISDCSSDVSSVDFVGRPDIAELAAPKKWCPTMIFQNQKEYTEVRHGYSISMSEAADKTINADISFNARANNRLEETGGLLLGEIDDSLEKIWIDISSGAPPDSIKSEQLFQCGTDGTKEMNDHHNLKTEGSTRFIGVWHTHPVSRPNPSEVDIEAMARILHAQERTPRHVVMLIIGHACSSPEWKFYLFRRNEFIVIGKPDEP